MTEKKLYTCDICHTDYANKTDAQKCEKGHVGTCGMPEIRIHAHENIRTKFSYRLRTEQNIGIDNKNRRANNGKSD